jgi:septal ring factor EnvC (AmiA/AmiB activator)
MTGFTRLLLPALCCLTLLNVAYASQQEELENLRKRIAAVQHEMDKTSESKTEAADALRESERAISNANRKLAELTALQRAADQKLGKLQGQQEKLNADMSGQQALLGKLLYQQYLGGKHEYLKLLLNNQDPNQVARDLRYYQYIARGRATWLADLRQSLAELETISMSTRDQRAELASLREEQTAQGFASTTPATPRDLTPATRREPPCTVGRQIDQNARRTQIKIPVPQ